MAYTKEYLEAFIEQARGQLPRLSFGKLHREAMSRAGGKARHRGVDPARVFEKIGVPLIRPEIISQLADGELSSMFDLLAERYAVTPDDEGKVRAAAVLASELKARGISVAGQLAEAAERIDQVFVDAPEPGPPVNDFGLTAQDTLARVQEQGRTFTQDEAAYQPETDDSSKSCGACRFFLRDPGGSAIGRCSVVGGPINWFGTSRLYISAQAEARAVLGKSAAPFIPDDIDELWKWGEEILPLWIEADYGKAKQEADGVPVRSLQQLTLAARWAFQQKGSQGLIARASKDMALLKSIALSAVPSVGSRESLVTFVAASPDGAEAMVGKPLVGDTGVVFDRTYLSKLGLPRHKVSIMYAVPVPVDDFEQGALIWKGWRNAELDRLSPNIIVALGKDARDALDGRADYYLPHPDAIAKKGDRGEIGRKMRTIRKALVPALLERIQKGALEKKIVRRGAQYCVTTASGDRTLGCHPTLAAAQRQLSEVESRKQRPTTTVQALIFDQEQFTRAQAMTWAKDHDFSNSKVDETAESFRLRQIEPSKFVGGSFRTIDISSGIKAVIGRLKPEFRKLAKEASKKVLDAYEKSSQVGGKAEPPTATRLINKPGSGADAGTPRDELEVAILKVDHEQQIVSGVVLTPYVVGDSDADWADPAFIQEAAHRFLVKHRITGFRHKRRLKAEIVESFVVKYPTEEDGRKAHARLPHRAYRIPVGNGFIRSGEWVVDTKILEADVWEAVKNGELNSYSIGGFALRIPTTSDEAPPVQFIEVDFAQAR